MTIKEILEYNFIAIGSYELNLFHIIKALLVLIIAKIFILFFQRVAKKFFKRKNLDPGRQFAFLQFGKYIIYTIALLIAIEAIGVKLSIIWGGAAALLVGIGLGLQQTFNDVISGIILLIEGSISVGNIIEVNGIIGIVTKIGLRSSTVYTRDKISIIVPNSKLVGDNATNWSYDPEATRFELKVGVAYSSDVDLVTSLLLKAAEEHDKILIDPKPQVQFQDFDNSSINFRLLFFSFEYWAIDGVRSELRYKIFRFFRENKVEIPFPQQDLWIKNPLVLDQKNNNLEGEEFLK